tara:strand:+ start:737 stop:1648 length:912 start_codon:yes stop_codon:yes gene_type:complete
MKKRLIQSLEKSKYDFHVELEENRLVAEVPGKGIMTFEDYTEDNLNTLVKNNKKCYVDLEFWNYSYCSSKNINPVHTQDFLENLSFIIQEKDSFSEGTVVILILLHEILLNVYTIKSEIEFLKYLENIKLSKKIIRNFMLKNEYQLPLTENYLHLILKTFDEETIYDFIFRECCYFTIEECQAILKNYSVKNIHLASYYVNSNFTDIELKLKYFCFLLEYYDGIIDYNDVVIYDKSVEEPLLGYYLLTLPLTKDLEPRYYYTMRKYVNLSGSLCVKIIGEGEKETNEMISNRRDQIMEYFDKY